MKGLSPGMMARGNRHSAKPGASAPCLMPAILKRCSHMMNPGEVCKLFECPSPGSRSEDDREHPTRMFSFIRFAAAAAMALSVSAGRVASQGAVTTASSRPAAPHRHPMAGLYRDTTGAEYTVMDLSDQTGGRITLALLRMRDGWARVLAPSGTGFAYGSSWAAPSPVVGRLDARGDGPLGVVALRDSSSDGERLLRRVALHEEEFEWTSRGHTLAGTLVSATTARHSPTIAMIAGSGPLSRRTTRYIADWLAAHGFTVLAYDKPGTGRSQGLPGVLGHEEWATDVTSALARLARHPLVDSSRMGLFAASEGGFIAPRVARDDPRVSFVLCRVCSAQPHLEAILDQEETRLRAAGVTPQEWAGASAWLRARGEAALGRRPKAEVSAMEARSKAANETWRRHFTEQQLASRSDSAPYWAAYLSLLDGEPARLYPNRPIDVLYLLGKDDDRVYAAKQEQPLSRINERIHGRLRIEVLPCADHSLLRSCEPGDVGGFHPEAHRVMLQWLLGVAKP